jgi:transposase-like protein
MQKRKVPTELIKELLSVYEVKDTGDIKSMIRDLVGDTLQSMLNSEMDEHLGYEKYDTSNKETDNSRNGRSKKSLRSEYGEIDISVPRDREGAFEPQIVKKHQSDISGIDAQIISMYAKGMSNRDIEDHMRDLYGVDVSPSLISRITDKILPEIREWQSRELKRIYPIVFMDAIHYSIRKDNVVEKKAVYTAIGIDLDGQKDVLGLWIGEAESSRFWLGVMNEFKNRGVQDILIASVDGLNGFTDAIRTAFPQAEVQRCIIHQIRSSTKYVSWKDIKAFMADLKLIYKAATEDEALLNLEKLAAKWSSKYPGAVRSWENNWVELSTYFKYPPEIRKIIYTTNAIENFNRGLRKFTKTKAAWPTEDALLKALYLSICNLTKRWTGRIPGWGQILNQLQIYFEGRIKQQDLI